MVIIDIYLKAQGYHSLLRMIMVTKVITAVTEITVITIRLLMINANRK